MSYAINRCLMTSPSSNGHQPNVRLKLVLKHDVNHAYVYYPLSNNIISNLTVDVLYLSAVGESAISGSVVEHLPGKLKVVVLHLSADDVFLNRQQRLLSKQRIFAQGHNPAYRKNSVSRISDPFRPLFLKLNF